MAPFPPAQSTAGRMRKRLRGLTAGPRKAGRGGFRVSVEELEKLVLLTIYPVTSASDSGPNTLRAAITASDGDTAQVNTISFNIPGSGVQTINLASALPNITSPVIIDATTQPIFSGTPLIELNGAGAGGGSNGLVISAGNTTVEGLVIDRFGRDGIDVIGNNDLIAGNFIGTNPAGSAALANGRVGVLVNGNNATIGGSTAGSGNLISGNTASGVQFFGPGIGGGVVQGNKIGTNVGGTAAIPNKIDGVLVNGQASGVLIGTNGDGVSDGLERNVISGNANWGVQIADSGTRKDVVAGNYIGTGVTGTSAVGNGSGGVLVNNGARSNLIGTDGVSAVDADEANVISGNNGSGVPGVDISDAGTNGNVIAGNLIGTDPSGSLPLGNGGVGVFIVNGAQSNVLGTNGDGKGDAAERNVISNNPFQGVFMGGSGTNNNVIAGNLIGTDVTGTKAMGNGNNGVWIQGGAQSNRVGVNLLDPGAAAEPNVLSSNGFSGIILTDAGTKFNSVTGNLIGTDITGTLPLGNGNSGVAFYSGSQSNTVGGVTAGLGNVIAYSAFSGVTLTDPTSTGDTIRGNRIFGNTQIGIDLKGDGVTANHIGGTPSGPNNLQNYPVITSTTPGPTTTIAGSLSSLPNLTYTIDFYSAPKPDLAYYGAAQAYLGSTTVTTDASGNATFTATLNVATTAGQWVSATATSPMGDTSEFSEAEPLPWNGLGVNGATWVPTGPGPIGNSPVFSGRMEASASDPTNPNVMYVAADGGGIWKTTDWLDPSPVWTPLTDDQPSLEAGSGNIAYQILAVSKSSPNIVYAAVGGPGGGILKSTNSGASWMELANSRFDRVDFGALVVNPTDPNTLYVTVWFNGSTAAGLYKSTDGGVTWVNKTSTFHNGAVSDVVMDQSNPSTLYAGMVQGANGGSTNGIYKSTDAGNTWIRMTTGTLSGPQVGVSIKLAISPSSPQTVYATVFDPALGNSPDGLPHRYVSTNGATSWTAMSALPGNDENRYWHAVLAVDPTSPNVVYTNGDHSVYKSTNYGATWTGSSFDDPVAVSFDDTGAYVLTGDRGIYRSTNGMAPFAFKQGNLQTAELYTLTLDPTNPDVAYGISQDQLAAMKFNGGLAWSYLTSGDEVGKILVDPTNPGRIYSFDPNSTTQFVQRSEDGGATWTGKIAGLDTSLAGFNYAYTSQKAFVIDPGNHNRLLLGGTHVYETTNNADSWTDISPLGFPGNPFITAIGVSPSQGNTIYVAMANGHLYATQNDGATWTERDAGLPVDSSDQASSIQVDPTNPNHVFIAAGTFPNSVFGSSNVWTTTNGGVSWTSIRGDLPPEDFTTSLVVDWRPATPVLYVGTARGVFASTNLGVHWATYKQGLPNVEVNDLEFLPQFNLLAAASYGRGVFEILTAPLQVTALAPKTTGFTATFNEPLNPAPLNLYDTSTAGLGPADVTLVGASTGPVRGSLIVSPGNQSITFVKTGGLLPPDTYTLTLRSAANGFVDTFGGLLDGNKDGTPGDNYTTTFTVAPSSARVVAIPDFARGPGQPVNVPATAAGLPLTISDGTGVTRIALTIAYDPTLLAITGASLGADAPAGASVTVNTSTPGRAILTFTSPTALTAGLDTFATLVASVPNSAPYASKEVLILGNIAVNGGAIAATDDDGVHVVAYLGDATGNGGYSGLDATLIRRVLANIDTGFAAFPLLDPTIAVDIANRGSLTSLDATYLSQYLANIPQPRIPTLPGVTITQGGPDPLVWIPQNLEATPGSTLTVPVLFRQTNGTSIGLDAADLAIEFDPSSFTVTAVRPGDVTRGFSLTEAFDNATGEIIASARSTSGPITLAPGTRGTLLLIDLTIRPGASLGGTRINLLGEGRVGSHVLYTSLDHGHLTLAPAPKNSDVDPTDGVLTVAARAWRPVVTALTAPAPLPSSLVSALSLPGSMLMPAGSPAAVDLAIEAIRGGTIPAIRSELLDALESGESAATTLVPWTVADPSPVSPAPEESFSVPARKKAQDGRTIPTRATVDLPGSRA